MSSGPVSPGSIVAWWDGNNLRIAVVGGQEKRKIRLVQDGGRETRVPPSRIAFPIEVGGPAPADTPEARRAAGDRAAETAERIRRDATACDVELLWEVAAETRRLYTDQALAELALGSDSGRQRAALIRALLDDGIHFVRKGHGWEPRAAETVDRLRHERCRATEREEEKRAFLAAIASISEGRLFHPGGSVTERRYLDALEQLAVHGRDASESTQNLAREALEASGIAYDRPFEGAFHLLRAVGRFDSDDENLHLLRFRVRAEFPQDVLEHARRAAGSGFPEEGRADLTALELVTVDSPHTTEIDDGLSLEPLGGDRYRVGIHIADPCAFVAPDDPVDREALDRGVTHYLPDRRLLMIPEAISEDAASLEPGVERPALSFLAELDGQGELVAYRVVRSVVRSRARLSYDEADRAILGEDGPLAESLRKLREVLLRRERRRLESGAIRIEGPAVDVHVNASGRILLERHPIDSPFRQAVGEAMVLAGAVAASFCRESAIPAIYRRQPPPDRPLEAPPEWNPVTVRAARRTLRRAEVGTRPGPHYALGLPDYAQATSPLRRYQDLATHRQIVSVLESGAPFYDEDSMQRIAATTERAEIESRRIEQWTNRYWLLRYIEQQAGEAVSGVVVELKPRPVVQLEETLIEQPVPALQGAGLGERVELRLERVNPRADLLVLRRS